MQDRHELSEPMDFTGPDLEPIVIPVMILRKNPEDGKYRSVQHVLKEASEDASVKWRNAAMRHARYEDGQIKTVGNVADCEPVLVSYCLFEVLPDGTHKPVPEKEVRDLPSRIVTKLFDRARKISGLDDDDTEESLVKRIEKDTKALEALRKRSGKTQRDLDEGNS